MQKLTDVFRCIINHSVICQHAAHQCFLIIKRNVMVTVCINNRLTKVLVKRKINIRVLKQPVSQSECKWEMGLPE